MNEKKELIRRNYEFNVRAENDDQQGAIITGRPIVYNSLTDLGYFNEIIERGALNNTDLTDVRFLINHDFSRIPLARSRRNNGNSTMQLTVDANGLLIRVSLDIENNNDARALYSAVKRGDITGMSFAFSIDKEEWTELDTDKPTRHIKSISSVVECSAVTFPAYEDTEIHARDKATLESAKNALENARAKNTESLENDSKEKFKTRALMMMFKKKEE